ncbi:MAG: chlorhexidine efflux transporter [Veillonella sp.]|nr:chlorhexidine efflux transporter [Veillonella sp.]
MLYELGCILIGCLVMQFVPHEGQPFVFNWIFDKLVPGDRIMYMMQMTFWMAFMTDITMTLVILGYTYVYNWVYDRARLYFVEA